MPKNNWELLVDPLPQIFLVFVGIPAVIASFFVLDSVVRLEHREHRQTWESDGKPIGFFSLPEGGSWFSGSFARNWRLLAWLFFSPGWIRGDARARKLVIWPRVLVFTFWSLCIWGISDLF